MTFPIAHRGLASDGARENSLTAVAAALDHVPVVEIDVRCTHDGVAVCAHDGQLQRTHGIDLRIGRVDAATLAERAPDVPTLADVLDLVAARGGGAMLDVKSKRPRAIEAVERTVVQSRMRWNDGRQLRRGEPIDPGTVTFQSDDAELLQGVRSRTGAGCLELIGSGTVTRHLVLGAPLITAYAHGVTLPHDMASRGVLRVLRGLRLGSYVYTVNDQGRFDELSAAGASGVYTDHVDTVG